MLANPMNDLGIRMPHAKNPLIIGNWKMNGLRKAGQALARGIVQSRKQGRAAVDLVLCPPATLLGTIGEILAGSGIFLGAQDCHQKKTGAHTGDVSADMLADIGCRFVILGHSERREGHGESDRDVAAKVVAAHAAGLIAIVCVGESAAERDAGAALDVIEAQLMASLPEGSKAEKTVIAYEPLWAIGSGRTPTADEIKVVHERIRANLGKSFGPAQAFRILYGGSVMAANAAAILSIPGVNGALIGGASLNVEAFCEIAESCG